MISKLALLVTTVANAARDLYTNLTSARQKLADAHAVIAQQAETIETLKKQVEQDALDDAALEKARDEAIAARDQTQTALDELTAQVNDATALVAKVADEINAHPDTPVFQADLAPSEDVGGAMAFDSTFHDSLTADRAAAETKPVPVAPPVVGGESVSDAPVPQVPDTGANKEPGIRIGTSIFDARDFFLGDHVAGEKMRLVQDGREADVSTLQEAQAFFDSFNIPPQPLGSDPAASTSPSEASDPVDAGNPPPPAE